MKKAVLCVLAILLFCGASFAQEDSASTGAMQRPTQSWHGLTGLYVIPTARMIGKGNIGMNYNESKHVEYIGSLRFSDRQVRANLTYGLADNIEASFSYVRSLTDIADNYIPQFKHYHFNQIGLKWQILKGEGVKPAVALAVRDLTDDMTGLAPLKNIYSGRKFFLLMSKKVVDKGPGRFIDAHAGLTHDDNQGLSGLFGFEFTISPQVSMIAEGMWDSPYLNFRGIYSRPRVMGRGNVEGRFIHDIGFRLYPDTLPGLALDAGYIGDGVYEFSFGASYTMSL